METLIRDFTIRRPTAEDVLTMVELARGLDRDEIQRVNIDPNAGLADAVKRSVECYAGFSYGKLACIWGIQYSSVLGRTGYLWMISTKEVEKSPFVFLRASQIVVKRMKNNYDLIEGHVDAEFERSVQWLKWLKFTIKPPIKVGNDWLRPFEMRNN